MAGQDPFEVKMLPGETFTHYLIKITMAIAHHVTQPHSPFHDPAVQARCLLSGLSQEEPWISFKAKYEDFINTGEVGRYAEHFNKKRGPWKCVLQELAVRDAADRMGTPLAWYLDAFPETTKNVAPPPAHPGPSVEGNPNPSPPLSPALNIPIDEEGYQAEDEDLWAGDEGYDVWEDEKTENSGASESVKSVINIVESPEVVVLSSDEAGDEEIVSKPSNGSGKEEDTWSSGSETNNSSDPDFNPRRRRGGRK
jgi:hypothetical protein